MNDDTTQGDVPPAARDFACQSVRPLPPPQEGNKQVEKSSVSFRNSIFLQSDWCNKIEEF